MAGPQNMYQTGYPNPQQQAAIRQQFPGAGPMGMMGAAQQQGMMPQQAYGQMQMQQQAMQQQMVPGMQQGMPPQPQQLQQQQLQQLQQQQLQQQQLQMQQQAAQQQQQVAQQQQQQAMQQQMQQQQQQQVMQQQQQQQQVVQPPQPTPPQPPAPAQQSKEFNTASLCRLGQETVHDIISRTQEVFQTLKVIQPPNGTPQGLTTSNEKKTKVQEQLRTIRLLFKRLRLIYEKCNENCQGMEYTHIESLIPIKEEWDMKSDEKKSSEAYRQSCEESKEIMEQVILKNRHLKEVIDHLRRIIWEINTMLTMRRS